MIGRLAAGRPAEEPAEGSLEEVVDRDGGPRDLAAEVGDQPDALRGERHADLRRLGDPLDQHLRLVAGEDVLPDAIGDLAVDRPPDRLLEPLLVERVLDGVGEPAVLDQAGDRPLDGGALEGADDRLLDRDLDRPIDPGRTGDPADAAGAPLEEAPPIGTSGRGRPFELSTSPLREKGYSGNPPSPDSGQRLAARRHRRRRGSRADLAEVVLARVPPLAGLGPGPVLEIDQVDGGDPGLQERGVVVLDPAGRPGEDVGSASAKQRVQAVVGVLLARDREVAVADHVEQDHRL